MFQPLRCRGNIWVSTLSRKLDRPLPVVLLLRPLIRNTGCDEIPPMHQERSLLLNLAVFTTPQLLFRWLLSIQITPRWYSIPNRTFSLFSHARLLHSTPNAHFENQTRSQQTPPRKKRICLPFIFCLTVKFRKSIPSLAAMQLVVESMSNH